MDQEWQWLLPPAWRRYESYYGGLERVMWPGSLSENALGKLQQAERLKRLVAQTPVDASEHLRWLLEWAIASDETTRLVIRAEEQLSAETLHALRARSDLNGQWETYRTSPSQLRILIEQYAPLQ
jgi:hypothetical protein